jgi:hypothetical protein
MIEDAQALTEGMARAHEARYQEVGARRHATANKLAEFHHDRVVEEAWLKASLKENAASRRADVAGMMSGLHADSRMRHRTITSELKTFERMRLANTRRQHRQLVSFNRARIGVAYRAQKALVAEIAADKANMAEMISDFHADRLADTQRQHQELMTSNRARVGVAYDAQKALVAEIAADKANVDGMISDFNADRLANTRSQHRELMRFNRARVRVAYRAQKSLVAEIASDKAHVTATLGGFLAERVATGAIWRNYVTGQAQAAANHVGGVHHRSGLLDDKVFGFMAGRPNGVSMLDVERHFHASPAKAGHAIDELIEQNRARKDEARDIYFAT